MKQLDVITVGSALRDVMYYTSESSVIKNPKKDPTKKKLICVEYGAKIRSNDVFFEFGGGASNTAVNFAGLGLRAGIITSTGDDFDGRGIHEHLESARVDTSLIQISKKYRTGFSFLAVDKRSGEHTAYVYYGAAEDLVIKRAQLERTPTKWFYVASLNAVKWQGLLDQIFKTQSNVAWNPGGKQLRAGYRGLKRFIEQTTVLIVNRDEATELSLSHPSVRSAGRIDAMLKRLHSWGPEIVVITDSRAGSYAYDGDEVYHMKAPQDKPKDTTGAGDCYGSSFVAGLVKYKGDIKKSMKLATTCATHLVHSIGAQHGLITWKDLPASLKK